MTQNIPCTVQVVTRNNAEGLKRCLDSLTMFDEVIVQDGYSTDGTREMAASYPNVKIMDQNRMYLNVEGRITDFGSMRNESIKAAKHDWIFVVDGDEHVDPALIREVGEIVARNQPGVFQAFRRFYIDGKPVMFCSFYPALQIRLFHRSLTSGYAKPVHERLQLKDGVTMQTLKAELPVPQPPVKQLLPKYERYLAMEVERLGVIPMSRWFKWIFLRNLRSSLGMTVKALGYRLLPVRGKRMPLSFEFALVRHSLRTIVHTFPPRVAAKLRTASHT